VGLAGNEFVEVGVGKHAPRSLAALTDNDVAQLASGDVRAERLDRCTKSLRRLGGRAQSFRCWRADALLALARRLVVGQRQRDDVQIDVDA